MMDSTFKKNYKIVSEQPSVVLLSPKTIDDRLDSYPYDVRFLKPLERLFKWESGKIEILERLADKIRCGPFGATIHADTYVKEGVILIRPFNLTGYTISENDLAYIDKNDCERNNLSYYNPGDLLFARVGNISFAVIPNLINLITISPNIIAAKFNSKKSDSHYICAFLNTTYGISQIERQLKIVAQPTIGTDTLKKIAIPIPTFEIQTYIGSKVRLAEKYREEVDRIKEGAIKLLNDKLNLPPIQEYNQLHWLPGAAFVDPVRLDPRYYNPKFTKAISSLIRRSKAFGNGLLTNVHYGASVPADYSSSGIPFIRGVDLLPNRFDFSDLKYLPESYCKAIGRSTVKPGDVLITRSGSVGTVAVIPAKADSYAFGSFMIRLRFIDKLNPYYVAAFLNSPYGMLQTERLRNGAVQENINIEEIDRILLPIISDQDQEEIASLWIKYNLLLDLASEMISEAKSDVEKLIEGKLDTEGIISGRIKAPTWDGIEAELGEQTSGNA